LRKRLSDAEKQRMVDAVAQATREGLSQVSSAELDTGWKKLERALSDGKYPSVPIVRPNVTPWYLRGIVFVSMILGVGIVADWRQYQREMTPLAPLHFVLEGTSVGAEESIEAPADTPAELVFSDRSRVKLAPNAKIAVMAMDSHGARVALANGDLEVSVKRREGSSWRFDAGPFTVAVKGTAFHLAFEATRGRLALQMHAGVVEVKGPSQDRRLTLRAGESLELFATEQVAEHPVHDTVPGKVATLGPPQPGLPISSAEPATGGPQPAPTAGHMSSHRVRSKAGEGSADSQGNDSWSKLIARGEFAAVVKDAEDRGLDVALARSSAAELTSLADAARYTRRNDVARQALLRVREHFAGTNYGSDAAFFLGRLAEAGPSSSAKTALDWYETYLRESARGAYAGEVLGREITLLSQSDRERARGVARQYLERFPHGSQADLARSLLQSAAK
jgi:hypothetical protein